MRKSFTSVRLFFYLNQNQFSSSQAGKTRIKIQAHCPELGKSEWKWKLSVPVWDKENENLGTSSQVGKVWMGIYWANLYPRKYEWK